MAKLIVPTNVEFPEYKGFVIKVDLIEGSSSQYIGLAVEKVGRYIILEGQRERKQTTFQTTGTDRNEVGRKLQKYVDQYRRSVKERLIIS